MYPGLRGPQALQRVERVATLEALSDPGIVGSERAPDGDTGAVSSMTPCIPGDTPGPSQTPVWWGLRGPQSLQRFSFVAAIEALSDPCIVWFERASEAIQ